MGRRFDESKTEMDRVTYPVVRSSDGMPRVKVDDKELLIMKESDIMGLIEDKAAAKKAA